MGRCLFKRVGTRVETKPPGFSALKRQIMKPVGTRVETAWFQRLEQTNDETGWNPG